MTRTLIVLVCICFSSSAAEARRQASYATVTPAAAVDDQEGGTKEGDLLGLLALKTIGEWISSAVPRAFEAFVTNEQRLQLVRSLRTVATSFANVNAACEALAWLAASEDIQHTEMDPDFNALLNSIRELRRSILELAADLGDQWREKGQELAFGLADLTKGRANLTRQARDSLLRGKRDHAVKNLRAAAALAEEAQRTVIGFLSSSPK